MLDKIQKKKQKKTIIKLCLCIQQGTTNETLARILMRLPLRDRRQELTHPGTEESQGRIFSQGQGSQGGGYRRKTKTNDHLRNNSNFKPMLPKLGVWTYTPSRDINMITSTSHEERCFQNSGLTGFLQINNHHWRLVHNKTNKIPSNNNKESQKAHPERKNSTQKIKKKKNLKTISKLMKLYKKTLKLKVTHQRNRQADG